MELKLEDLINDTEVNSVYIEQLVSPLVEECCKSLDKYVAYIATIINDRDNPITDEELEDVILTLPTLMYYAGEVQERLGIKYDVANAVRLKEFNQIMVTANGTVAKNKAEAELAIMENDLVKMVYDRAYNIIKQKIQYAFELLQSAKKIMTRRMQAFEITKNSKNYTNLKD